MGAAGAAAAAAPLRLHLLPRAVLARAAGLARLLPRPRSPRALLPRAQARSAADPCWRGWPRNKLE
eukprot:387239-Pyramimonas_sp.AAC.1